MTNVEVEASTDELIARAREAGYMEENSRNNGGEVVEGENVTRKSNRGKEREKRKSGETNGSTSKRRRTVDITK